MLHVLKYIAISPHIQTKLTTLPWSSIDFEWKIVLDQSQRWKFDRLLKEITKEHINWHWKYTRILKMGLCDDLLLLDPTSDGMQVMQDTCHRFPDRVNLKFSTDPNPKKSKTKCIFVTGKNKKKQKPENLILDGKMLPWVESAIHLGHVCHQSVKLAWQVPRATHRCQGGHTE